MEPLSPFLRRIAIATAERWRRSIFQGMLPETGIEAMSVTGGGMSANYKLAQEKAEDLLRKFGLSTPPIDPETIAEALGVEVVYARFSEGMTEKVSGYLEPAKNRIVVNRAISPARKTYTIAHELGHFIMHKEYAASENYEVLLRLNEYNGQKPDEEKEADAFAANLLVPIKLLKKYKDYATVPELARTFCVSEAVILNRLNRA